MASFDDPLVVGCVIGVVVDMFVPSITMSVYYGAKQVTNGCNVKPSLTSNPPKVTFSGHPNLLYTLVMVDPDAPSPSEPSLRKWVHWIVVDIPGGTNVGHGKEFLSDIGPHPMIGIHPYVVVLFQQKGSLGSVEQPTWRPNFSTRAFANHFDLGLPAATIYFNAQKEPTNRRR